MSFNYEKIRRNKDQFIFLVITVFVELLLIIWSCRVSDGSLEDNIWLIVGGSLLVLPYILGVYKKDVKN